MKRVQKRKIDSSEDNCIVSMPPKIPFTFTEKCNKEFFNIPCYNLANLLLGKLVVRSLDDGSILKCRIVETECYLGGEDKASHSFNGRRTLTNEPMYMEPGTCYVYMTYGMYYCFNISSAGPGSAVLIRAGEPISGIEKMMLFRTNKPKIRTGKAPKTHELCNGPSKLCISMNIEKNNCNKLDLCESSSMWIESDNYQGFRTVTTSRIGIDSVGEEWAKKPLRFYIIGNNNVSKRDKVAEEKLQEQY